jgi:hypothetical protein
MLAQRSLEYVGLVSQELNYLQRQSEHLDGGSS